MEKIKLIIGLTILLVACNQKKDIEIVEKFDKSDLEFFNLKGPVKDFTFIGIVGDGNPLSISFDTYSKYVEYQTFFFDNEGYINSINTFYSEYDEPKTRTIPIRVRTKDTLTINMSTVDEDLWRKYFIVNDTLSVVHYNKIHKETENPIKESYTKFSYDLNGSWTKYETGQKKDLIYDRQVFKNILNNKNLDSLVYVYDENKKQSSENPMYSITYLEFDSYGNWTKRFLEKHTPYLGYGSNFKRITEIRKINYY